MNYGEELTYWYLRLNGFFPITNFVVHRSQDVKHTSDIDVLAIRPPHVFEEVGGQTGDWDGYLTSNLNFSRFIGVICEVKTGRFDKNRVFREEQLRYTLPRLGLIEKERIDEILRMVNEKKVIEIGDNVIGKIFISEGKSDDGPYLNRTLQEIEDFLVERVNRYPVEKYGDRMFFPSHTFQFIISQVYRSIEKRKAA